MTIYPLIRVYTEDHELLNQFEMFKDKFCFKYTISNYNDNINIKELYNFKISVILTIGKKWKIFEKLSYCPSSTSPMTEL